VPRLTAIELSGDACVLVAVRIRRAAVDIERIEMLDPSAFPGEGALSAALAGTRRTRNLPRRARVVLWGVPDAASPRDPDVKERLAPLTDAGFQIDRVVSPQNALAALARLRIPKPESATIWLAIDRSAVAIVAARPGELLYSHSFGWNSSVGATGSQARLLQRYSLVAFLAPEVGRAMTAVRERGGRVDAVITCGTLPDLRSLTMPLIEELDVEVETLDFLDGLQVQEGARERAADMAPAIRLACAGAVARPSRLRDPAALVRPHKWLRIAAVLFLLAIGGAAAFLAARRTPPTETIRIAQASAPLPQDAVPTTGRPAARPAQSGAANRAQTGDTPRSEPSAAPPPPPDAEASQPVQSLAQEPQGAPPSAPPARAAKAGPAPLHDPLPNVSTILVSENRRLALVDGRIVSVGDSVGRRTVAQIEPHAVRFREPSGLQIRVGLGGAAAGTMGSAAGSRDMRH
jgi:hypothetical protein